MQIKPVAVIHTDFPTKFGVPRQSGITENDATVVFLPKYRNADAVRGLENFSHIWLIWQFSCNEAQEKFIPTVRPPRLGGNEKVGVFASRSPFRPNPLGLSCLKLKGVELHPTLGPLLHVSGADLVDNTPIYDIKPYIPYTDSRADAFGGFAEGVKDYRLDVELAEDLAAVFPKEKLDSLLEILAQDPRPSYHEDESRIYGFPFAGFEIKFRVSGQKLTVTEIFKI